MSIICFLINLVPYISLFYTSLENEYLQGLRRVTNWPNARKSWKCKCFKLLLWSHEISNLFMWHNIWYKIYINLQRLSDHLPDLEDDLYFW